jgi:salicylate hydroxylase
MLHFPVAGGTLLNVVAFVVDPNPWPLTDTNAARNMTGDATRADLEAVFGDWCPTVRNLVGLLPDRLTKWALFDTYDHPAPTYVRGRVCVAGDAAHASSPHHGGGAGIGVEDTLALCTLLEMAMAREAASQEEMTALVEQAFRVYDAVRKPRSQWLVQSSREVCDIYEWNYPATMADWDKCMAEIEKRSHKLWYFDIEGMLKELREGFEGLAGGEITPKAGIKEGQTVMHVGEVGA